MDKLPHKILVLDGGMGTTLEDTFKADTSSTLWSSSLLSSSEGQSTLNKAHTAFLDAGADLIETCTYQCSLEGFRNNGFDDANTRRLMRKAVQLVSDCVGSCNRPAGTVLSLSCYGAVVTPVSQDYSGDYPAPFGPRGERASAALADWFYERIKVFSDDKTTWNAVSAIAIETIPLLSEAVAIQTAVTRLYNEFSQDTPKHPWWISFVFPDGKPPQKGISPEDIVTELYKANSRLVAPDGIGVNCTKMQYLPDIIQRWEARLAEVAVKSPWLVLYPDGGLTYDTKTRRWNSDTETASPAVTWAETLSTLAQRSLNAKRTDGSAIWAKIIVGGCCKAGPDYIAELAKRVRTIQSKQKE